MSKAILTAIAIATGVLLAPNGSYAAGPVGVQKSFTEATQIHQVKQSGRHKKRRYFKHRHKHHRHAGGHIYFGYDHYDRPFYRSCRNLKRKAYRTGSRYWWRKYRKCMDRYYY